MRLALLLLLALPGDDRRAVRFFEQMRFQPVDPQGDEARRVVEILQNKDHWVGAFRTLEEKLGPFPDGLVVTVEFDFEGEQLARAYGKGSEGRVSFNLKRLAEQMRKVDEFEEQRKTLEAQGKTLTFKVPPLRFDRMIYHELTHVLQRSYPAPDWFNEGMAQWVGEDLNCVCNLALGGEKVDVIDAPSLKKLDQYARGHLFFEWLESRGAVRKVLDLTVVRRRPWKESVEEGTGLSWPAALQAEREWSAREVERLRDRGPKDR